MYIQGLPSAYVHGPHRVASPHRAAPTPPPAAKRPAATVDEIDISPQAQLVGQALNLPEIRVEKVAAIKAAIAAGEYETDEKLSVALDRLLDEYA